MPGCLLILLTLVLTWELIEPELGADNWRTVTTLAAPVPAAMAGSGDTPAREFDAAALADVAASVAGRPLFSPGRRPSDRPASTATVDASRDGLPRLTGVIVGPSGGRAIFAGADGKSRTAAEGDAIGTFKVQTIGPGLVTLSGSEGDRVLRPTYITTLGTPSGSHPGTPPGAPSGTLPSANDGIRTREGAR